MHDRYLRPKEGFLPKYLPPEDTIEMHDVHLGPFYIYTGIKGVLFCDIDGTVADIEHRRIYVSQKPNNYPMFEKLIPFDTPKQDIIDIVNRLYDAGWKVVMMSGRSSNARSKNATLEWLDKYGVKYHAIYMRKEFEYNEDGTVKLTKKGNPLGDYRRDDIVKFELLQEARADGYDPDVVFDDRDQVVAMWRENSIPVVQVAEGDF